jgi:hypothetical protein
MKKIALLLFAFCLALSASAQTVRTVTGANSATINNNFNILKSSPIVISCSDLVTTITAGTNKAYFRMPYAATVTAVRASLLTEQTGGSIFTIDINESGTTILSTLLTIDNNEKTSTTAAAAAVISDTSLASDAEITIDIDQVGTGTPVGCIVEIFVTR